MSSGFTSLIAVDIGNSATHLGVFSADSNDQWPQPAQVTQAATSELAFDAIEDWLLPEPSRWCVASVHRQAEQRLAAWINEHRPRDAYQLLSYRDLPLDVRVDYPERVGVDRLVGAVAANRRRSADLPAIVIDAGSAVTVDLVAADGAFLGGAILPGIAMSARALADGTDLLPFVRTFTSDDPPPVVGKSTEAAIRSGLFWGTVGAVRELVDRMNADAGGNAQVFVTGGYADILAALLGQRAEAVPSLVLSGIALVARRQ
jgi:type III pantothenate kinase